MKNIGIRPLGNKILIKEDEPDRVSKGGILIPSTARDGRFAVLATVYATGRGKFLENGTLVEQTLKKGDRVVIGKAHGTEVKLNGEVYRMVDSDLVEGVIEED